MTDTEPDFNALIIDTVGSIAIVTDDEGRVLRFNAAGTRILGYRADEVLGRVLWDIFPPPEHRQRAMDRFAGMLNGAAVEVRTVWMTRDGKPKHLEFSCRAAAGPSGRIEYTIGTGIDITDRIATENAVRDSEQRFRASFAKAAIGMALVDINGKYLHVNHAFCKLTGYDEHELLERDLYSISHPDDVVENRRLVQEALAGKSSSYLFEKRYITKSGEPVWVQVSASVSEATAGRPATLIGLFENISQRKAAERVVREGYDRLRQMNESLEQHVYERTAELRARTEELARSEEQLREQTRIFKSILDSMGDAVYVADAEGRLTLVNPAAERISGPIVPGNDLILDRVSRPWFFRGDGTTPYQPEELPLARSARGESVDDEEVLVRRTGLPEIWTSATSRPLHHEDGSARGSVLVVRDVTQRKRDEAALRAANVSLRESEGHFKELAESNLRLAREVEHRVRNNLAGLLGLLGVMRDQAPDAKSFADAMEGRLAGMLHVHQLLAQTRWTAIGLRRLVEGALSTLQHMAPHSATVEISGPDVYIAPAHVLPLTLVLVEWFMNSCKYGPHSISGGALAIAWEATARPAATDIQLTWTERGGPPIARPIRASLGTSLVEGFVRRELRGRCELRFPTEGAEHRIQFTEIEGAARA